MNRAVCVIFICFTLIYIGADADILGNTNINFGNTKCLIFSVKCKPSFGNVIVGEDQHGNAQIRPISKA